MTHPQSGSLSILSQGVGDVLQFQLAERAGVVMFDLFFDGQISNLVQPLVAMECFHSRMSNERVQAGCQLIILFNALFVHEICT